MRFAHRKTKKQKKKIQYKTLTLRFIIFYDRALCVVTDNLVFIFDCVAHLTGTFSCSTYVDGNSWDFNVLKKLTDLAYIGCTAKMRFKINEMLKTEKKKKNNKNIVKYTTPEFDIIWPLCRADDKWRRFSCHFSKLRK